MDQLQDESLRSAEFRGPVASRKRRKKAPGGAHRQRRALAKHKKSLEIVQISFKRPLPAPPASKIRG
jgi:hypothetical protein